MPGRNLELDRKISERQLIAFLDNDISRRRPLSEVSLDELPVRLVGAPLHVEHVLERNRAAVVIAMSLENQRVPDISRPQSDLANVVEQIFEVAR